jgi:hypothetical protein
MVGELGVEVAELYETANFLLRRRHWLVYNGPDILSIMKFYEHAKCSPSTPSPQNREEALYKAQLQALLFAALKHKTQVLQVFIPRAIADIDVVEVDINDFV